MLVAAPANHGGLCSGLEVVREQEDDANGEPEEGLQPVTGLEGLQQRDAEEEEEDGDVGAQAELWHAASSDRIADVPHHAATAGGARAWTARLLG